MKTKNYKKAYKKADAGVSGESAQDRALNLFAEMMISKIESIAEDWRKPWFTEGIHTWPKNMDGRHYNGMNSLMLLMHCEEKGYQYPVFCTFDRVLGMNYTRTSLGNVPAVDADGNKRPQVHVLKGEKSFPVFLTTFTVVHNDTKEKIKYEEYKKLSADEQSKYTVFPKMQVFNVFNIAQTNLQEARLEIWERIVNENMVKAPEQTGKMFRFEPMDKMMEVGAAVKTAAVGQDGEKMYLRLTRGSLVDGSSRTDNILIPHATERTAGVMSAEDYASLQALIEQSGQGDEEEQTADVYRITAEPKGNRLFVNYPNKLSVKGYVPYLYRYSVRRTHFGRTQSGGNDRIHGERRKGWHRNYDDQRLKVGTNYEILIGRLTNPGQDVPHWDYLDNGPRELFGVIHDLSDGTGRWIGYRFMFGLKQFCFYPESSTHRFTFGIAFGPPLTETKKKIYPHEMVTNIAPFHVEVKFDPDDQQGPQEAPELNFRFCI